MQESLGLVLALVTTLSWSVGIFPFTIAARKLGVNALNHFRLLVALLLLLLANLVISSHQFASIFNEAFLSSWFWLGLSGIIGLTIGDYFGFKMYAILGPRVGSVLSTLSPIATLIFGMLILHESMNSIGVVGILITIAGVMGISFGRKARSTMTDHAMGSVSVGIISGILAAMCQGAGLVLSKKGMMHDESMIHVLPATFIRIFAAFASLVFLSLFTGRLIELTNYLKTRKSGGIREAITGTFFGPFLGVGLSLLTIQYINVSVAQTIFSLVPLFALLISLIFYKERITAGSVTGIIVALCGVFILIWRNELTQILFH